MDEIAELKQRVARLEAESAVRSVFNEYLYYLDCNFAKELVSIFAEDAVLDVINFPPGSGKDLHFKGRAELSPLYLDHSSGPPSLHGGHHATNIAINVAPSADRAELSAYFMTSGGPVLQGGMYQITLRKDPDRWHIADMRIMSSWGWAPTDTRKVTDALPGSAAKREGRPVLYEP